jgi:hypothetical protein
MRKLDYFCIFSKVTASIYLFVGCYLFWQLVQNSYLISAIIVVTFSIDYGNPSLYEA